MYPTRNTLPEKVRIQVCGLLQEHLANSVDLATQAKQAHWNVKGPDFISLHELFDEIAKNSQNYSDLIAERIVQLGGIAEGALRMAAARSTLPAYPGGIGAGRDHVDALSRTLAVFGEGVGKEIQVVDGLGDRDTADILTEISRAVDKYLWFVEAHLQASR